jgi:hypothetical protein
MGGNGRELWLHGAADLLDARLQLRGDAFVRHRFSGNLQAPYAGTSGGLDLRAAWRARWGEVAAEGGFEAGPGWSSGRAGVRVAVWF